MKQHLTRTFATVLITVFSVWLVACTAVPRNSQVASLETHDYVGGSD